MTEVVSRIIAPDQQKILAQNEPAIVQFRTRQNFPPQNNLLKPKTP
jgi:hypothetical protein